MKVSATTHFIKPGCALRGQHGKEYDEIVAVLLEYNKEKCQPPLLEAEVKAIAENACKHPAEMSTRRSGKRLEQSPLYWFPLSTREWFSNQNLMLMNDAQTGQYIQLLMLAWDRGGLLTADKEKLWRLAKANSREEFDQHCELVLAEYEEVIVDGEQRLRHPKLANQYMKALADWMKKKEAGEASKAARLASLDTQRFIGTAATSETPTAQ